jgi:hypothetical protein
MALFNTNKSNSSINKAQSSLLKASIIEVASPLSNNLTDACSLIFVVSMISCLF